MICPNCATPLGKAFPACPACGERLDPALFSTGGEARAHAALDLAFAAKAAMVPRLGDDQTAADVTVALAYLVADAAHYSSDPLAMVAHVASLAQGFLDSVAADSKAWFAATGPTAH